MEEDLLGRVSLPLNLQGNARHPFNARLSVIRKTAKTIARETPVAQEGNQQRRTLS
jgi:hypothetical protein